MYPYSDGGTLTSSIEDLIIYAIVEIRQPITEIVHSETFEDLRFRNLAEFQEEDPTFFDFH